MENIVKIENFQLICRICMNFTENLISIDLYNIVEMVMTCFSVKITSEDCLPKHLCETCFSQLQIAYNLKFLCEKSDKELRQMIIDNSKTDNSSETKIKNDTDCKPFNIHFEENLKQESEEDEDVSDWEAENMFSDSNILKEEQETPMKQKIKREKIARDQKKYKCDICDKDFTLTWRLGVHMKKAHKTKGQKCSRCSVMCYHKVHLEEHENAHTLKKVFCQVCGKGFRNNAFLRKHMVYHSDDKPYFCSQCDMSFQRTSMLRQHCKRVHVNHKLEECKICNKSVRQYYMEQHMQIHVKRTPFSCGQCSREFCLEKSLLKHVKRVHQNEETKHRYLCNVCGQGLSSPAHMKQHLRSHTGEKPFTCTLCNKQYNNISSLNFHVKAAHLNERPWICSICSYAFHTKTRLRNHMFSHTGERPHQCLICKKTFPLKNSLRIHMKTHGTNNTSTNITELCNTVS